MAGWRADAGAGRAGAGVGRGRRARARVLRASQAGFVLTEVMVATVILVVGLMGSAGLVRLAAREMGLAARAEGARWAAAALADSLVAGAVGDDGERAEAWGTLRWSPSGPGILVKAVAPRSPAGGDGGGGAGAADGERTLARVWVARLRAEAPPPEGPP